MNDLSSIIADYEHRLLFDSSIPVSTRAMVQLHMRKPWIPNHWTVLIKPTGTGSDDYLERRVAKTGWALPSKKWWMAHARSSHPPDGSGCDPDVHIRYLSVAGDVHEFDYASLLLNGDIDVLGPADFILECNWWRNLAVGG